MQPTSATVLPGAARLSSLLLALLSVATGLTAADPKSSSRMATYKLRPMDVVKIQVFQEPDLDRELRVSQDHTIVVPLVGVVNVKDRSVRDTELLITRLYKQDYLVNPQINLTVTEYSSRSVNVLGAVNAPGSVLLPPEKDLSLIDVIARSGGFSRLANRTRITVTRINADGVTESAIVNADTISAADASDRLSLQDGDIITVPERML